MPYCRAKCAYCDFYSGPLRGFEAQAYVDALKLELESRLPGVTEFSTVYVGGGTPSTLDPQQLEPFLRMGRGEVTVEVNPEDVTAEYAAALRQAGANRVSMGVQSLVAEELAAVGRRHTPERAIDAFHTLRAAEFDNVSLDLIYGLPGQTVESWVSSLEGVMALKPEHLSAYCLSYEPGTLLHTKLITGKLQETPDDDLAEMYAQLCHIAAREGFEHYEISNFARPGRMAEHNSSYWDMTPYLGLGPGAHSFLHGERSYNLPSLKDYLKMPTLMNMVEVENEHERHNDQVMTALRTSRGVDPELLAESELAYARECLELTSEGRLRIAEADWLRSDLIITRFIRI